MPPLSYIYWTLLIIWAVFGFGYGLVVETPNPRIVRGGNILLFVLFVLLGLQVFK